MFSNTKYNLYHQRNKNDDNNYFPASIANHFNWVYIKEKEELLIYISFIKIHAFFQYLQGQVLKY